MKEDIKILEEMKQNCLTKREYVDTKAERKAQAIENLIKGYRELEYENKYLKEHIAMLISLEQENIDLNNELNKLKSKIKESIEEYKQEMKEIRAKEKGLIWNHRLHKLDYGIQVLQELMEDE